MDNFQKAKTKTQILNTLKSQIANTVHMCTNVKCYNVNPFL